MCHLPCWGINEGDIDGAEEEYKRCIVKDLLDKAKN